MLAKILIIVAFVLVTVGIGAYYRKRASNVSDFVLGGRSVGPWLTAFAYGTSYFSSVVFVGYAGQFGWNFGVAAVWIGIGNALIGSLLAWVVLGRRTRIMTKHLDAVTMPEFFAKRFGSPSLKIAASVIIFLFLVPYSASVYKGLSQLFAMAFGIDFIWCILGIMVLTGVYVVAGGYKATAANDFIQGIIMLAGIALVVVTVLGGKGGFTAAITELSRIESPSTPEMQGALVSFFGPDPLGLVGVMILTSLGAWGLPQMVHKFYTIRDDRAIRTGTVISTLFAFVIAGGSYFMGAFGRLYHNASGAPVFDDIVPDMLSQALPDLLIGVVLVLVLSASMSTLSSLVITSSSTFTLDLLKGTVFKKMSKKGEMLSIRLLCAVFVVLSALIAMNPSNLITTLMSISWGALAGAFLGPFMFGLFWKRTSTAAVWASFVTGIAITGANFFLGLVSPPLAGAVAIVASLVVTPLVTLVSGDRNREAAEHAFACIDNKDE